MNNSSDARVWYADEGKDRPTGPMTRAEIKVGLESGRFTPNTLVYGPDLREWQPIAHVPELSRLSFSGGEPFPPMPKATYHPKQLAHEIDFRIEGEEMQYVEVELDPGEAVLSEAGAMMYMSQAIEMETIFGDGNEQGGIFDKLLGAGKRILTGESLFMTVFSNKGVGKQHVAFAAPYPGKIIPMNLAEMGGRIICQKDAFLCAAKGVSVDIAFQKRIGVGLFGGEGFIMQKLEGDGLVFVHAGGTIHSRELAPGEQLKVDSGCLVALEPSIDYDIVPVGGVKSAIFGGEGFFFASLRGPGTVWLQSLPFSRLAGRIHAAMPHRNLGGKGEGSVLGNLSGIGGFFDGD